MYIEAQGPGTRVLLETRRGLSHSEPRVRCHFNAKNIAAPLNAERLRAEALLFNASDRDLILSHLLPFLAFALRRLPSLNRGISQMVNKYTDTLTFRHA